MRTERLQIFAAVMTLASFQAAPDASAQRGAPSSQGVPAESQRPSLDVTPTPLPGTKLNTDWRASRLIGTTMTNMLDEAIGDVQDVVIDSDGKVVAVIVGVGGFLGLGETTVNIGLRHLVITQPDPDKLEVKTSLTRRAIEQAATLTKEDVEGGPLPTQ